MLDPSTTSRDLIPHENNPRELVVREAADSEHGLGLRAHTPPLGEGNKKQEQAVKEELWVAHRDMEWRFRNT